MQESKQEVTNVVPFIKKKGQQINQYVFEI